MKEPETPRLGKAIEKPKSSLKKVNSDQAKLNMQKKGGGKRIRKSEEINRLYREVKIWNDSDPSHGSGNFKEQAYPFTVDPSKIGVRIEFFGFKKDCKTGQCLYESVWLTQRV